MITKWRAPNKTKKQSDESESRKPAGGPARTSGCPFIMAPLVRLERAYSKTPTSGFVLLSFPRRTVWLRAVGAPRGGSDVRR